MKRNFPAIKVCGTYSPAFKTEFSQEDNSAMISAVNNAKPDVLWVGMTAPKQEKWIYENHSNLQVPFIAAIGAVFDFYAGDGEEREGLINRISSMGLKETVHLMGNVAHNRLTQILNAADIFILTSVAEGVPNAILEAMACGLPVVATDVGGISEVVKPGVNGFLIDTRQPRDVAKALRQTFEKQEVLGQGAIVTINKNYSMESVAKKNGRLFKEVVSSQTVSPYKIGK